jgi:hypothetical protein
MDETVQQPGWRMRPGTDGAWICTGAAWEDTALCVILRQVSRFSVQSLSMVNAFLTRDLMPHALDSALPGRIFTGIAVTCRP